MGKKHFVNDLAMPMIGFSDCALQHHFMVAPVIQSCISGSDSLECWEINKNNGQNSCFALGVSITLSTSNKKRATKYNVVV